MNDSLNALFSSLYQPYVNLASALQTQIATLVQSQFSSDPDSLGPFILALARLLSTVIKLNKINNNSVNVIGWPLSTKRYILLHLCSLPIDETANQQLKLKSGDFYLRVNRTVASADCAQLELCFFDRHLASFHTSKLSPEQIGTILLAKQNTVDISQNLVVNLGNCIVMDGCSGKLEKVPRLSCKTLDNKEDLNRDLDLHKYQLPLMLDFTQSPSNTIHSCKSFGAEDHLSGIQMSSSSLMSFTCSFNGASHSKGSFPKDINKVRYDLLLEKGPVRFAHGVYPTDGSAIVEVEGKSSLLVEVTASELARLFAYLYYVQTKTVAASREQSTSEQDEASSSSPTPALTAVVDCRNSTNLDVIGLVWQAFSLLLKWIPDSLRRVFWVVPNDMKLEGADDMEQLIDDEKNRTIQDETIGWFESQSLGMAELEQKISAEQLSKDLGGEKDTHSTEWVNFRKELDIFLHGCRSLGELYVELYKELRRSNSNSLDFWTLGPDELQDLCWNLQSRLQRIETSDCFGIVRDEADLRLEKLHNSYPELKVNGIETYLKAVEKAGGLYSEVRKIMEKAATSVKRRCDILNKFHRARAFVCQAKELTTWFDNVALATANRQQQEPSVSLMRLRIQERQYEQFLTVAKAKLEVGEQFVLDNERLCNQDAGTKLESDDELPFTEEQKTELNKLWNSLIEKMEETSRKLYAVRDHLADSLICHHMLDKVYDWALHNAKWSSQLNVLVSSAINSGKFASENNVEQLVIAVQEQLDSYPAEQLRQLPSYADRLNDEQIQTQSQALTIRCVEALKMLKVHKQKLDEVKIREQKRDPSPSASTEYEQPIRSSTRLEGDAVDSCEHVCWRRRSYAGTSTTSLGAVEASYEHRYRPLGERCVDDEVPSTYAPTIEEEEGLTSGIITDDMTHQVVSYMSENTLKKKLAERRSAASSSGPVPPPNPLSLCKGIRLGSARYLSKHKKPFRKLLKRSVTLDELAAAPSPPIHVPFSKPTLNSFQRHGSIQSLTSIGEESLNSGSSGRSIFLNGHDTSELERDEFGLSPPFPGAFLPIAQHYRPESPPADASPDQRMQYMIINELLQTELSYVASLQYVIQHYVPEMLRDDLPQELRGQRYTVFGNIERIFEFHIQKFLPALQERLNKSADSLCLEIGKCFLEHRSKFHLYALYNKNKPKSDVLMADCGSVFFKTRQLLLSDRLDLCSYLLKPVQRMGKYALLLQQLLKACPSHDQEACDTLRRAEEMVSFQLRHGNDLLAMDLIRGCDVNLKEQGQLMRQDEFVVVESRGLHHRKCVRRVFLFEHLVLFAKPKRRRGSQPNSYAARLLADTYQYKYSIKMSDAGLTEKVGDSEVKFELWFRRHTSSSTTVIQATTPGVREIWIRDIAKLLWRQAVRNRDLRLTEMNHMGIGDRSSCVDLKASVDRIEDRAVNSTLLSKMARFRSSFAALTTSNSGSQLGSANKRPHSLISVGSSSCSSSNSSSMSSNSSRPSPVHPGSIESGICADLATLEELPDDCSYMEGRKLCNDCDCNKTTPAILIEDNGVTV